MTTLQNLRNKYYDEADSVSRGIIQHLVINMIVMKQLTDKKETTTRNIFNKIKDKWMDLVIATTSESQFIINSSNLQQELSKLGLSKRTSLDLNETNSSADLLLPFEGAINIDLLRNAIVAYAFSFQNLDIDTIKIDVLSYKKKKGTSCLNHLLGFLLRDLQAFAFLNKRELGYGIKYKIHRNVLHFFGQLADELKDDTIVIHLRNQRGMILREIYINEESLGVRGQSCMESISEAL